MLLFWYNIVPLNMQYFIYKFSLFLTMNSKEEIKKRIIIKLVRWKKWGGAHTENILKGLPAHLRGSKITKKTLKELEKDEWILPVKKTGEIHYSLNPQKANEILQFYEKHFKKNNV